jgi:hypothetical protein
MGTNNKITDDIWRDILNRLVLRPRMKEAARNAGINPTTLFGKIKDSIAEPDAHRITWLGHDAPFFQHVNAARKLNVVALDHAARDLAINGHSEPRFHDGKPVYRRDPKVEADAITLDELDWLRDYGTRKRSDTYYRDPQTGALEQEMIVHPPNPAILVKLLTSLAPEIYGERSEITHTHQGSVWIEGSNPAQGQLPAPGGGMDFNQDFGLTPSRDAVQRPTNTLAIPRPCADSAEFDKRFRKKMIREVVLFRDTEGKLLPPLPDDVVVAGTIQARVFEDAKIEVQVVHPTALLDEGFENNFLRELAPTWRRKPGPKAAAPTRSQQEEVARRAAERIKIIEPPGKASSRPDAENIGKPRYGTGGRRVVS